MEITVEFVGGPMDGEVRFSTITTPRAGTPAWLAWMFYRLTGGEIGKKAIVRSPTVLQALRCAASAENQEMSNLLKLYSDSVNEYEAADENKKAQLKEKIDAYKKKCSTIISDLELNNKATPQVIKKFETEYKEITKKYTSMSG